jgi:hypothetical protein
VAALWATAVAWSEYAADQNGAEARAQAGSDPQAAELRRAFSAALSESEAVELRRTSAQAAEELRSIVGSVKGHDISACRRYPLPDRAGTATSFFFTD